MADKRGSPLLFFWRSSCNWVVLQHVSKYPSALVPLIVSPLEAPLLRSAGSRILGLASETRRGWWSQALRGCFSDRCRVSDRHATIVPRPCGMNQVKGGLPIDVCPAQPMRACGTLGLLSLSLDHPRFLP